MSVSAVTMRVSAPSVDSRSGTTGQMPTDALLLPPCATPPQRFPGQVHPTAPLPRKPSAGRASTVAACASPWLLLDHSALALAPSQVHPTASTKTVRRMRLDRCWIRFPVVVCWTPPWLWHPARFTPQLPRKPSAGCASTVAGSAFPWLFAGPRPGSGTQPGSPHSFHENRPPDAPRPLLDPLSRGCLLDPALALAPSQVHPTASTKTVRRMRLDRCWIRFPVVVAGPLRPGSGTQPGSPHSFHENRPPDAPRPLLDPLPRGCLLDPALALAPSQVHPTARSLNSRRPRPQ
jgi:hypothetical protein